MAEFAASGYDGLSMRKVAQRLDAQAGSLYYHVPNKSALIQLTADRVAGRAYEAGTAALSLMERLLETLHDAGIPAGHAAVGADTLLSHTTGFVLQEQSQSPSVDVSAEEAAALHTGFPLTVAAATAYTEDERFIRSVRLVCAGLATHTQPTP
ncbi:TetR/AcrR family transcriptional regulator [Streptomyces sp. NPDC059443]|uniref:TetR/AcrR family transcriptional regulator n=1 Tax=unclassified Streptomyces TaxID=2593676 RepID=UPI0036A2D1EE